MSIAHDLLALGISSKPVGVACVGMLDRAAPSQLLISDLRIRKFREEVFERYQKGQAATNGTR
jgi:hypothetical protein